MLVRTSWTSSRHGEKGSGNGRLIAMLREDHRHDQATTRVVSVGECTALVGDDVLALLYPFHWLVVQLRAAIERRVERIRAAPDRHLAGDVEPGRTGTWGNTGR